MKTNQEIAASVVSDYAASIGIGPCLNPVTLRNFIIKALEVAELKGKADAWDEGIVHGQEIFGGDGGLLSEARYMGNPYREVKN